MNDFLHANSKYIAAIIAGLIAVAHSLGLFGDPTEAATWAQFAALLVSLGFGYLLPSPLPVPPPEPPVKVNP